MTPAMGKLIVIAALSSVMAQTPPAQAHLPAPAHGCRAPERPANDQDEARWQRFLSDVDAFRACISTFADDNRAAAQAHEQAANEAVAQWNAFVRRELNVPEDYPWPPPERERR